MKNSGSEMATKVTTLESLSLHLPSLMAEMMPMPTAKGIAIRAANPAKNKVLPKRGRSSSTMTRLLVNAVPKSPWMAEVNQFQNRMGAGTSRPNSWRKITSASGVAPWPNTAEATSPGKISVHTKIKTETAQRVKMASKSRLSMSFAMVSE